MKYKNTANMVYIKPEEQPILPPFHRTANVPMLLGFQNGGGHDICDYIMSISHALSPNVAAPISSLET